MADETASSRDRLQGVVRDLPIAHKVVIGASLAVVVLAGYLFLGWISSPSYSVLAADISDSDLSQITLELDSLNVPYRVEAAGDRVMVPRSELSTALAGLAAAGIDTSTDSTGRAGFELLDDQGLAISTNLERINFQRALEGELARSLRGIDRINDATVHLVLPDDRLFGDPGQAEASVIVDVPSDFNLAETDAVANLVAGAVENLAVGAVTIIDIQGRTLLAPASSDDAGALGGRNVLRTVDFEQRLEEDITRLLLTAGSGDRASVMVRADLSYDEIAERTEAFDQDNQIPIRENVTTETFTGPGSASPSGGVAGVDGEIDTGTGTDTAIDYNRQENTTEYGVNSTVTNVVKAPGEIESLHVGVVVDDGTLTGATVVDSETLSALIGASIGIDETRGDTLVVTAVPFELIELAEGEEAGNILTPDAEPASSPLDLIPQAVGAVIMLIVAGVLIMMMRKSSAAPDPIPAAALPPGSPEGPPGSPAAEGEPGEIGPPVRTDLLDLVHRQPEDIATLLRGWLTTQ